MENGRSNLCEVPTQPEGQGVLGASISIFAVAAMNITCGFLATGARAASRGIVEHVVACCHDLRDLRLRNPAPEFVSLFDDTSDVWSVEDFNLVEDLTRVTRWSRSDEFERMVQD